MRWYVALCCMLGVIMDHVHGRRVDVIEHILLLCGEHVVLLLAVTSDSSALMSVFSQCVFSPPCSAGTVVAAR